MKIKAYCGGGDDGAMVIVEDEKGNIKRVVGTHEQMFPSSNAIRVRGRVRTLTSDSSAAYAAQNPRMVKMGGGIRVRKRK